LLDGKEQIHFLCDEIGHLLGMAFGTKAVFRLLEETNHRQGKSAALGENDAVLDLTVVRSFTRKDSVACPPMSLPGFSRLLKQADIGQSGL
jgi:hypothetical protein